VYHKLSFSEYNYMQEKHNYGSIVNAMATFAWIYSKGRLIFNYCRMKNHAELIKCYPLLSTIILKFVSPIVYNSLVRKLTHFLHD